jgi:uncharacterized protein
MRRESRRRRGTSFFPETTVKDPRFEWDDDKDAQNRAKHGIDFDEASEAFDDPWAMIEFDAIHSDDEERWLLLGSTLGRRTLVVVVHTHRDGRIRVISARRATRAETRTYEER